MKKIDLIIPILVILVLMMFCGLLVHLSTVRVGLSEKATLLGDINSDGIINDEDIYYIKGHILKRWQLTKEEYFRADMNQDGNITSFDVVLIRMAIKENEK